MMAEAVPRSRDTVSLSIRMRTLMADRVSLALIVVFLPAAAFYVWTAGTSFPLTLHGGQIDRYNLLADALLHFHLSIGPAPAGLLRLTEPYNPIQNIHFLGGVQDATKLNDDVLYHGRLYFLWGPAPALVFLVPLHLIGLEPSSSVTVACFAVIGLGFALGTLRVLLRQIGGVPLWMCLLAAATLALSSTLPFILRTPSVTEDTIAGGFCFTMAGIWLTVSALAERRASLRRLAMMSLCFGLATGSRPTLGLAALALIPVYLSLRRTHSHRPLLLALTLPVSCCLLLLLAYNQARFGNPLEFGVNHQLAGYDPLTVHFADTSYIPPGAWFYTLSPPRPTALFPFIRLTPPPVLYPATLPSGYITPEITGGLLPMTPILLFLPALPWFWRRRPAVLGALAAPLLILAGTASASLLYVSYQFFATTERYEVDFSTLFLLGALAAWLALSRYTHGGLRRLTRFGGGLLAAWGCITGLAISFIGYGNYLAVKHPATWTTLEHITSPLATAIAASAGHPVLAEVRTPYVLGNPTVSYTGLDEGVTSLALTVHVPAYLTIVSPTAQRAALTATVVPGVALTGITRVELKVAPSRVWIDGPGRARVTYAIPRRGREVRVPVQLSQGVNHLQLAIAANATKLPIRRFPLGRPLLVLMGLSLASHY
jgi:hypothetical protein